MAMGCALLIVAVIAWALSAVADRWQQRKWDREFWDRWHEERRPGKGSGY